MTTCRNQVWYRLNEKKSKKLLIYVKKQEPPSADAKKKIVTAQKGGRCFSDGAKRRQSFKHTKREPSY